MIHDPLLCRVQTFDLDQFGRCWLNESSLLRGNDYIFVVYLLLFVGETLAKPVLSENILLEMELGRLRLFGKYDWLFSLQDRNLRDFFHWRMVVRHRSVRLFFFFLLLYVCAVFAVPSVDLIDLFTGKVAQVSCALRMHPASVDAVIFALLTSHHEFLMDSSFALAVLLRVLDGFSFMDHLTQLVLTLT